MTHTKGPWFLDTLSDGSMIIQPGEGFSICPVTPREGFENDVPNFRLMAAAPELLEALHEIRDTLEQFYNGGATPGQRRVALLDRARAAIAKAERG